MARLLRIFFSKKDLEQPFISKAVITFTGHDHMVQQCDVRLLTSLFEFIDEWLEKM
jgi:hypothetical protein